MFLCHCGWPPCAAFKDRVFLFGLYDVVCLEAFFGGALLLEFLGTEGVVTANLLGIYVVGFIPLNFAT